MSGGNIKVVVSVVPAWYLLGTKMGGMFRSLAELLNNNSARPVGGRDWKGSRERA